MTSPDDFFLGFHFTAGRLDESIRGFLPARFGAA